MKCSEMSSFVRCICKQKTKQKKENKTNDCISIQKYHSGIYCLRAHQNQKTLKSKRYSFEIVWEKMCACIFWPTVSEENKNRKVIKHGRAFNHFECACWTFLFWARWTHAKRYPSHKNVLEVIMNTQVIQAYRFRDISNVRAVILFLSIIKIVTSRICRKHAWGSSGK